MPILSAEVKDEFCRWGLWKSVMTAVVVGGSGGTSESSRARWGVQTQLLGGRSGHAKQVSPRPEREQLLPSMQGHPGWLTLSSLT